MIHVININERGELTLPGEMRRRLGVSRKMPVVVEETKDGILLRAFPIEMYSNARLAEFQQNNEASLPQITPRLNTVQG